MYRVRLRIRDSLCANCVLEWRASTGQQAGIREKIAVANSPSPLRCCTLLHCAALWGTDPVHCGALTQSVYSLCFALLSSRFAQEYKTETLQVCETALTSEYQTLSLVVLYLLFYLFVILSFYLFFFVSFYLFVFLSLRPFWLFVFLPLLVLYVFFLFFFLFLSYFSGPISMFKKCPALLFFPNAKVAETRKSLNRQYERQKKKIDPRRVALPIQVNLRVLFALQTAVQESTSLQVVTSSGPGGYGGQYCHGTPHFEDYTAMALHSLQTIFQQLWSVFLPDCILVYDCLQVGRIFVQIRCNFHA